jgi:hypothetical protein
MRPQPGAKTPGHKKSNRLFKEIVSCSLKKADRKIIEALRGHGLEGLGK